MSQILESLKTIGLLASAGASLDCIDGWIVIGTCPEGQQLSKICTGSSTATEGRNQSDVLGLMWDDSLCLNKTAGSSVVWSVPRQAHTS